MKSLFRFVARAALLLALAPALPPLAHAAPLQYLPVYDGTTHDAWIADLWDRSPPTPIEVDFAAPAPGRAGQAIEVRFSPPGTYGAFGLADREVGWIQRFHYLNEIRTVEFDLYFDADSTGEDGMRFILEDGGLADSVGFAELVPGWPLMNDAQRRGQWHHIQVHLPDLHPAIPRFHRFLLFNDGDGLGHPHFRLADVRLGWEPDLAPPVIQIGSTVPNDTYDGLDLAFTTDEPTTFRIEYGIGAYDHVLEGAVDDWATVRHATLAGLSPGQTVQYRITASDHRIGAGVPPNAATVSGTFAMPDAPTAPPDIPVFEVAGVTGNRADLHWTVTRASRAVLAYRKSGGAELVRATTEYATDASFTLDLLEPASTYTVTLTTTDAFGWEAVRNLTLTTGSIVAPTVTITIHPDQARPISPWIYGVNFAEEMPAPAQNLTFSRLGGNRWTAYNWESNDSNAGNDWGPYSNDRWIHESLQFYNNGILPVSLGSADLPAEAVRARVAAHRAAGLASLITVQMQGYAAADHEGSVDILQPGYLEQRFHPVVYRKNAPFADPPDLADDTVYIDEFVWALRRRFPADIYADPAAPTFISLDNEPEIWFSTHREIQPLPMPMAEYLQRTIDLASAIKDVAPSATLFGPASYGFNGLVNWQSEPGFDDPSYWAVDRYLDAVRTASEQAGRRLVDVYDFHFYSAVNASQGVQGPEVTPEQVQAIVQSPRSLWDPTYREDSWIDAYLGEPVRMLDRIQDRIAARMPGMEVAVTEYNFMGNAHIAGGIAQADTLGIFGQRGVFAANFWPLTFNASYAYVMAGFRMYRDFDGARGSFGDVSLPTESQDTAKVAAYVSRDSTRPGRHVIVALNRSGQNQEVAFQGLAAGGQARVYRLDGQVAAPVFVGEVSVQLEAWVITLPPLSVSTIEITPAAANATPTAAPDHALRPSSSVVLKIPLRSLLANDSDPDGDPLSVVGVLNPEPAGARVEVRGPFVVYTAPAPNAGPGGFDYRLADGPGGHEVPGHVTIAESAPPSPNTRPNAVAIVRVGTEAEIVFLGLPGATYRVQYTTEAGPDPAWLDFAPVALHVTPDNGVFRHRDTEATGPARFYRAIPAP